MIPLSILDLVPIRQGGTPRQALAEAVDLAQHAEKWGYHRYWVAEHHNFPGIASAATSVVIGHIASGTQSIRIGSGGIMLPNHAPLAIAEQFGTLEALFPGRIDLGLGRAPGSDPVTARALRRNLGSSGDTFPEDLQELRSYFAPPLPGQQLTATPGSGTEIPLYLLGSSDFSARLAAKLGLPFAFASHFAPDYLHTALTLYRREFQPSEKHSHPHALVAVNAALADSDDEAEFLFSSTQQQFLNLIRGKPTQLPPPARHLHWTAAEANHVNHMTRYRIVGSPSTASLQLDTLLQETRADEIISISQMFDHPTRLRSFELLASLPHFSIG